MGWHGVPAHFTNGRLHMFVFKGYVYKDVCMKLIFKYMCSTFFLGKKAPLFYIMIFPVVTPSHPGPSQKLNNLKSRQDMGGRLKDENQGAIEKWRGGG